MKKEMYTLLVIDVQQVAFDGKITPPINNGPQLLENLSNLVTVCRSTEVPVLFTQADGPSGQPYAQDVHGWAIHPALSPRLEEQSFLKVGPSTFENPEFEKTLEKFGTTHLIVCGIWSESCVSITVRGALRRGYNVSLVADGHGTPRDDNEDAANVIKKENDKLADRGATIVATKQLLTQLLGH